MPVSYHTLKDLSYQFSISVANKDKAQDRKPLKCLGGPSEVPQPNEIESF